VCRWCPAITGGTRRGRRLAKKAAGTASASPPPLVVSMAPAAAAGRGIGRGRGALGREAWRGDRPSAKRPGGQVGFALWPTNQHAETRRNMSITPRPYRSVKYQVDPGDSQGKPCCRCLSAREMHLGSGRPLQKVIEKSGVRRHSIRSSARAVLRGGQQRRPGAVQYEGAAPIELVFRRLRKGCVLFIEMKHGAAG